MKRFASLALPCLILGVASALFATEASADILELKDGRFVEGVVLKDGDTYRVTDRFGVVDIAVKDVKTWTKGKSVDDMVKEHLARLGPEDVKNRVHLATWLTKLGRGEEAEEIFRGVLVLDPENEKAHNGLGHIRHRGKWVTPDEAKQAEGYEKHGGKWYTPQEWKNLVAKDAEQAKALEEAARKKKINADVNKYVRLMMSPDPAVRARGKSLLQGLAEELDNDELRGLVKRVEEHVKRIADLRKKAAAATAAGLTPGARGTVMGEIRATMSKLKRPIQTFETSLASSAGGAPVRIQLPELEIVKIRTVGVIPADIVD